LSSPLKQFFLRETRDGLSAFSGADLSRARFLTRSSKTLDREHRWNNAGLPRRGLSGEKNGKKKSSAKNTELEEGASGLNAIGVERLDGTTP
jgi:hypothetical protein